MVAGSILHQAPSVSLFVAMTISPEAFIQLVEGVANSPNEIIKVYSPPLVCPPVEQDLDSSGAEAQTLKLLECLGFEVALYHIRSCRCCFQYLAMARPCLFIAQDLKNLLSMMLPR
jgi:hypothetical protein